MSGLQRPRHQVHSGGPRARSQVGADAVPGRPAEGPGQTGTPRTRALEWASSAWDPCKRGARGPVWGPLCGGGRSYPCFAPTLAFGLGHPAPGPAPSSLRRGSCAPWPAPRAPPCPANLACPFTEAPGTFAPILALGTEGSGTVSPRKVKSREA